MSSTDTAQQRPVIAARSDNGRGLDRGVGQRNCFQNFFLVHPWRCWLWCVGVRSSAFTRPRGPNRLKAGRPTPLLHAPQPRPPGAHGQLSGLFRSVSPKRKFFPPADMRFWTPGRHPKFPDLAVAPHLFQLQADDAGRAFAPAELGPPAAPTSAPAAPILPAISGNAFAPRPAPVSVRRTSGR